LYSTEFTVEIVTPVSTKFEGTCNEIILPGIEGEMAVLGGHAPILTMLSPGVTVTIQGDKRVVLSTGEGFATIAENKVVCLVDFALGTEELDFGELRSELAQVQQELNSSPGSSALRTKKQNLEAKLKAESYGVS
jgi:F-type H+-transporting ATPase subunit epsilon